MDRATLKELTEEYPPAPQHGEAGANGADKPRHRLAPIRFGAVPVVSKGRYLIKGLIPAGGLTAIWGPPKSGKSFWATDALLHVALGWEYRGQKVRQGAVVYIAAEGGGGFGGRLEAFKRHHVLAADANPPFYVIPARLGLVSEHVKLIEAIKNALDDDPAVVCLDTLNRTFEGDENSSKDMIAYIAACDTIRAALNCAVILVHHCGIAGDRPRGHTSLTGAVDCQIAVKRDHAKLVRTEVEWMKDGPEDFQTASRLEVVEIGTDEDGEPVTSCVIGAAEGEAGTMPARQKMTAKQTRALDALRNCMVGMGKPSPGAPHYPEGVQIVAKDQWREYLFQCGVLDRDATNPRRDFIRLCDQLTARNAVREWGGQVWLCD